MRLYSLFLSRAGELALESLRWRACAGELALECMLWMPRWSDYEVDKPRIVTSLPDDAVAGMRLTMIDALGLTVYERAGCHDMGDSLTKDQPSRRSGRRLLLWERRLCRSLPLGRGLRCGVKALRSRPLR